MRYAEQAHGDARYCRSQDYERSQVQTVCLMSDDGLKYRGGLPEDH